MASANEPREKLCALCHKDCSTRPRTKDDSGHYYCRECIERVKQERQQRQQPAAGNAASPVSSRVEALPPDTEFDVLPEVEDDTSEAPVIAVANRDPPAVSVPVRPDAQAAPAPEYEDREFNVKLPEFVKRPWFTCAVPALILYLLFDHAHDNPNSAAVFLVPQLLFSLIVLVIIYVEAFRDGIGTGFLTLCLPPYTLYYVLSVNESAHLKGLFAVSLIAAMAGLSLAPDVGTVVQQFSGSLP